MKQKNKGLKKTALLIDGEADFHNLFDSLLQFLQLEVTWAENGEEAVKKIKENAYFLVVIDVHVSDQTGLEVLKQMKALRPNQKIVILSDGPDSSYLIERIAFQEGATECLSRPLELSEIGRIIHETAGAVQP
jgi:DNA-binding NtrC family response regulator